MKKIKLRIPLPKKPPKIFIDAKTYIRNKFKRQTKKEINDSLKKD